MEFGTQMRNSSEVQVKTFFLVLNGIWDQKPFQYWVKSFFFGPRSTEQLPPWLQISGYVTATSATFLLKELLPGRKDTEMAPQTR